MIRSIFEKKIAVILVSITALGALVCLSIGMKSVSFLDAQPIGRNIPEPASLPPGVNRYTLDDIPRSTQIFLVVSLILLLVSIAFMLTPEGRKRMLRILFQVAFSAWVIYYLFKNYPEIFAVFNFGANNGASQAGNNAIVDIPPPVFTPPQPSLITSYIITLSLVFAMLYISWVLYHKQRRAPALAPIKEIADIARSSLRDLSSGLESTNVIMNCYYRMSDVVADKRSLRRRDGMTPSEFAARLEDSGLPGDAVRSLTRLFEEVRYGRKKTGADERREAVKCLTSIVEHCGEMK